MTEDKNGSDGNSEGTEDGDAPQATLTGDELLARIDPIEAELKDIINNETVGDGDVTQAIYQAWESIVYIRYKMRIKEMISNE